MSNASIERTMEQLLANTDIVYREDKDNLIVLTLKTKESNQQDDTRTITGKVVDEYGDPIIGANVIIKGTTNGSITDLDGAFSIQASPSSKIEVTYIGYISREITVGNSTTLSIQLKEDLQKLSEVVVVGYGVQRKSDLTGSVANVKSDVLMERPATNVEQALAGRVAGVNISTNSGRPGGRTSIQIRGYSSINASSNPLYVVDGIVCGKEVL